jgi:hypothetical protein
LVAGICHPPSAAHVCSPAQSLTLSTPPLLVAYLCQNSWAPYVFLLSLSHCWANPG